MILRRYITQQVAVTSAIVLGFLALLILGGRLIRYFGKAAEGRLDVGILFSLLGYQLPSFLELILPLSFFIGLMLVFGRLYVDHEMPVINASGISRGQLGKLLVPFIALVFMVEAGLAIVAKPWGMVKSEELLQQQAIKTAFDLIKPGQFINNGNYHLYVGQLSKDKRELLDVVLIEKVTNRPDTLITAKRAVQVQTDPEEPVTMLDLFAGRRYQMAIDSLSYTQIAFTKYRISMVKPQSDEKSTVDIEAQSSLALLTQRQQPLAMAELGYRLSLPFLIILAVMLALPLSHVHPRQGRWLKLIPAIFIFVSLAMVVISLKSAVGKQKIGGYAYVVVLSAYFVLALYLNWQEKLKLTLQASKQRDNPPSSSVSS